MRTAKRTVSNSCEDSFTKELMRITGVSEEYAIAAYLTLSDKGKNHPVVEAAKYKKRFNL